MENEVKTIELQKPVYEVPTLTSYTEDDIMSMVGPVRAGTPSPARDEPLFGMEYNE